MFRQKERDKMKFWVQLSIVNSLMIISGTIQYCRFSNVLFNIFYIKKKFIGVVNVIGRILFLLWEFFYEIFDKNVFSFDFSFPAPNHELF